MVHSERSISVSYGLDIDIANPNLRKLITEGYKYDEHLLNEEFIRRRLELEYHYAHIAYFAKIDNAEVASLSIIVRPNDPKDPFWNDLQSRQSQVLNPNLLAIYMQGIVVHPSVANNGIASQLLRTMVEYYRPAVILGQTKTPEAVHVRSKVLTELGYRSFYGFHEITFGNNKEDHHDQNFIHAAFVSESVTPTELGVYFVEPHVLPSYFPITDKFSSEIQRAFLPIQQAQKSIGEDKVAASVLVSVTEPLLSR